MLENNSFRIQKRLISRRRRRLFHFACITLSCKTSGPLEPHPIYDPTAIACLLAKVLLSKYVLISLKALSLGQMSSKKRRQNCWQSAIPKLYLWNSLSKSA